MSGGRGYGGEEREGGGPSKVLRLLEAFLQALWDMPLAHRILLHFFGGSVPPS